MDNEPLSVSDFFNVNKKIPVVYLTPGAVMGREVHQSTRPAPPAARCAKGTDYAKKFVEEEERALLQGSRLDNVGGTNSAKSNFCEMEDLTSIASLPDLNDVEPDGNLNIYDHYNFTPVKCKLPIANQRHKIVRMVETNQVVIILGATGCGKTTQVPQFILDEHAKQRKNCNIIVTQPRRIAATSVAQRVCDERGWELSTIVGYQIGLNNKTSPDTRLTYCTTGVLREKLVRERNMNVYTHVIIDEVHERDLETDFLMLIVRKLLRSNSRRVKVVLMSATIDPSRFADYFSLPIMGKLHPAPVLDVEKRTNFVVKEFYIDQLSTLGTIPRFEFEDPQVHRQAMDIAARLIMMFDKIDKEEFVLQNGRPPNDNDYYKHAVLVFLPGIHEIETMHELLEEKSAADGSYKWHKIPLHSSISREEQSKVFGKPAKNFRKIILSTNIAESSITVSDVVYVIDFCLTKHLLCDAMTNFSSLRYAWASHSNCKQRAGRAGRLRDGRVYRMVPRSFFEYLPLEADPEMVRCPLTLTCLKAKLLKMGGPTAVLSLALDPPDLSRLETTMLLLKEAGALLMTCEGKYAKFDGDITFLGTVMSHLPVDIQLTRLIMFGNVFSILEDTIVMAAWMTVRNVFITDFHDRLGPYASKITYTGGSNSDCIAYLNAHLMFMEKKRTNYFRTSNDSAKAWCKRNFLHYNGMLEATELVEELRSRLKNLGVYEMVHEGKQTWDAKLLPLIRKVVIAGAFYPNYFVRGSFCGQVNEQDAVRAVAGKDPFSTVYLQGLAPSQPGELYAKIIKDMFEKYAGVVSNISFDGSSKVYIEFEREYSQYLPGKIIYPIYRAIKMRQLRIPVSVPLLPIQEAHKRMEKLGLASEKMLSLGKLKSSKESRLPGPKVQFIEFAVSWYEAPDNFWIQEKASVDLKKIQSQLNTHGNVVTLSKKPKLNEIYAAPYPVYDVSPLYYRVQIRALMKKSVEVHFIDYGNSEEVPLNLLVEIGPIIQDLKSLSSMPQIAMPCRLSGVGPSSLISDGFWSKKAITTVSKFFKENDVLLGEIYSIVDGLLSLVVKEYASDKSINDILVENGLAVKIEESLRSKMDNSERLSSTYHSSMPDSSQNSDDGNVRRIIISDIQHNVRKVGRYVDPPSREDCRELAHLRGPTSPLEMRVYGCSKVTIGKEVGVEQESVNSVLLDSYPEDPHERLMVAGYVSTNPAGTKLKIGHTTLMPNLHGLSSLMCLIFSPTVELRLSIDKSRYTGALCGLGCEKDSGLSFYSEHDMEISFDNAIDIDDILQINSLRYHISRPLETAEGDDMCDSTPAEVLESQKKVMEIISPLLQRVRANMEPEIFMRSHEWLQYDACDLLEPDFTVDRAVLRPHYGLALRL